MTFSICGSPPRTKRCLKCIAHRRFLEAQRKMTRSSAEYRLQEREIAEVFCEMHHIPTRSEVDELQRTVIELRRELRALKWRSPRVVAKTRRLPLPPNKAAARRQRSAPGPPRDPGRSSDDNPCPGRPAGGGARVLPSSVEDDARVGAAVEGQGPRRADRDHAEDAGVPAGQGHAASLPADWRSARSTRRS